MAQSTLGAVPWINPPPVTTSWQNPAVHPFNQVFGGKPISPELHPYDAYDETTWTLPEALLGKSKFLGQTFELLALMQNSFLLTVILPLVRTDEIQSHWSRWEFPAFIPDMVPHLGVVRFVKSNRISGRSTMARYGIGIFLEHGFMNTQEGMLHYVMNIRQLLAAVLEGMQLEALQALVNVGSYEQALSRKINPSNTTALAKSFNNTMKRELFAWGCLQQNNNAWALLNKKIDQIVLECYQNNNPFTHYITSTKVDAFLHQIPYDQVTASIYGPDAQRKIRDGAQDFRVDEFNNKIFSSRPFIVEENPVDPFERTVQIGEYVRCFNHIRSQMENYKTSSRTQLIYDEEADTFVPITLEDKVNNCHRFDIDGNLLHVREARKRGDYSEKDFVDFLHYTDPVSKTLKVVRYMFQLNPKDFNVSDYQAFITTFYNALERNYGHKMSDYERAMRELRDILDIIGGYQYDAAMDAWLQLLSRKNPNVDSNNGPNSTLGSSTGSVRNNSWGSLDIPTKTDISSNRLDIIIKDIGLVNNSGWILPPTHGNYGGFKTIANMVRRGTFKDTDFSMTYATKIEQNLVYFEELADAIKKMLPGSVPASPKFVNSSIHRADHRHALFENIISLEYSPRYVFLHAAGDDIGNTITDTAWRSATVAAARQNVLTTARNNAVVTAQNGGENDPDALREIGDRAEADAEDAAEAAAQAQYRSNLRAISNSEYGVSTANNHYAGRRVEESMFPNITESRKVVMDKILGNLVFMPRVAANVTFIGEPIAYPNQAGTTLRFSPIQTPSSTTNDNGVTKFARRRWNADAGVSTADIDFNTRVTTPTLSAGSNDPAFNNAVYDTLARWLFLKSPGNSADETEFKRNVNFYSAHTAIVVALALARVTSDVSDTYKNIAAIIDTIQEVIGHKLHDIVDPSVARYDLITDSMKDETKLPRLMKALSDLYTNTRGKVFGSRITAANFAVIEETIKDQKRQVLSSATSRQPPTYTELDNVVVANHTAPGYAHHRNANLSFYRQAPITLGREAMRSYPEFAYSKPGVRRAIPASFKNSSVIMSDTELDMARTVQEPTFNDDLVFEYLHQIGGVFAPDHLREAVDTDISMLPMISNARSRSRTPEEINFAERQHQQNIRRETTMTGTRSSSGLQALIGSTQISGNKRRRANDFASGNIPAELPSTPASQTTVFETELINPMKNMYASLVRTFKDDPVSLAIAVSYGFTPFTRQLLESTIAHHLDHPVDYLIARPHATFTTVGVIKMIPGLETGQMSFGNIIAEIGDDAAIQTHLVTETHYQGPVIKKPKNICVVNDVLVTGYKGGLGSLPINIDSYNPTIGKFGRNPSESIMYFMISRHDVMSSPAFSIVGKPIWVDRQGNGESIDRLEGMGYGTSAFYNAVWGFLNQSYLPTQSNKYNNQAVVPNTVVFKSVAAFEDPLTRHFSRKSGNLGHFGSHTVGTGMHRARIGETSFKNIPINPLEQKYDISW